MISLSELIISRRCNLPILSFLITPNTNVAAGLSFKNDSFHATVNLKRSNLSHRRCGSRPIVIGAMDGIEGIRQVYTGDIRNEHSSTVATQKWLSSNKQR